MGRIRWGVGLGVLAAALLAATQVGASTRPESVQAKGPSGPPIKIGISLPLTGRFSEPGTAAQHGYQVWARYVNTHGGLLGRPVQLIVYDDASDQNTIVSDYNRLINEQHVDLLLGTFSSFLNLPASAVAEKAHMVFIAPAGGSPAIFARGFQYYFFAQQATAPHQGDLFSAWLKNLKNHPTKVAYPTLNDPFAKPVSDGIKAKLEAAGFQTVYSQVYPTGTTDFDTIAASIKNSGAEIVVNGATFEDGVGLIRSMKKLNYNPKALFQTTAPTVTGEFVSAIGIKNTEAIMYAVSWSARASGKRFPLNHDFLVLHEKMFKGSLPEEDAADAFASAQVLMTAVKAVGRVDQDAIKDYLHSHPVRTILGPLSWDKTGAPRQSFFLGQWQKSRPQIVLPKVIATVKGVEYPKPAWQ